MMRTSAATDFRVTASLLVLTLAIGGAGINYPLLQLLLGSLALLAAGYFAVSPQPRSRGPLDRWAYLLLGLTLLLPLLQLVPLPPALWQLLSGRSIPREVDAVLGWTIWRPWTLDVEATVRSWLVLIPAAVVFVGCLRFGTRERVQLLWLVVGFALLNALLGIVQLATDGGATPYRSTHSGFPVGFFVNRNHSAALMLAAMPIVAALAATKSAGGAGRSNMLFAATSALAILTIVVIGTTSRTGLSLLPVSLLASLFILFRRESRPQFALPALVAIAALGLVLVTSHGFDRVVDRFAGGDDPRFAYWGDVRWALEYYNFAGTGVGTFVPVFQSAESLETVVPQVINHAHNDYLEILLVGGLPAGLLVGAFLVLLAVAIHRGIRSAGEPEVATLRFGAATAIALLLAYSVVDYPIRMPAIAAVFAVSFAILLPAKRLNDRESGKDLTDKKRSAEGSKRWRKVTGKAALGLLALVLLVTVQSGLSARAILEGRYDDAARWAFWSTTAHLGQSTAAIARNDRSEAWGRASTALRLSPISAPAIRNLALVRFAEGSGDGDKLMQIASTLGWRDPITQLWAVGAAQRSQEPAKAMQRAEALFRQQSAILPALQLLLQAPDPEPMARLLVVRLAQRPSWRDDVLRTVGSLPASELASFDAVLAALNRTNAPVTSNEMNPAIQQLSARGLDVEAQRLWYQVNPRLIDNGDFDSFRDTKGVLFPSGWDVPSQSRRGVSVAVYSPGNRGLRIGRTDWVTVLRQNTMLRPGSYTFSYQAHEAGPTPVTLRWQLRCAGSTETQFAQAQLASGQGWRSFTATFDVPLRDCPVQRLALHRLNASERSETWLDRIRFRPQGINSL